MREYAYSDFLSTLGDAGKRVAEAVHGHIAVRCPEYKPFNVRPINNASTKWQMNFRKKPEFGKAICSLYSVDGNLSIRVVGSGFMNYELLLRQSEFSDKVRGYILANGFCANCGKKCYYQYREYWYVNGELLASGCKKSENAAEYIGVTDDYAAINNVSEADINDLLHLLDIQAKHMSMPNNSKEVRGGDYAKVSKSRCGEVAILEMEQTALDVGGFEVADYCNPKRLDKYTTEYSLTPMGANGGLWFYHDAKAVCGTADNDYGHPSISKGRYAFVAVADPFSFSAWRAWSYIAGWMRENDVSIRPVNIDGVGVPFFVKFYRQGENDYMAVLVPVE